MRARVFLVLYFSVIFWTNAEVCPPCDVSECNEPSCYGEYVFPGKCPCCPMCPLTEGERCYNASIKVLKKPLHDIFEIPCGNNMDCLLRQDLSPYDEPEALCVCRQTEQVCGSDNHTYDNICVLNKVALSLRNRGGALYSQNWGPCKSVPEITAAPQDTSGPLNQPLALDCEARGFPIPDIHWEFRGDDGNIRNLPSDDLYVAVQVRGGPESYMVTSWVQIVDLRPKDTGTYYCVATNTEGVTRVSATVGVYKSVR